MMSGSKAEGLLRQIQEESSGHNSMLALPGLLSSDGSGRKVTHEPQRPDHEAQDDGMCCGH